MSVFLPLGNDHSGHFLGLGSLLEHLVTERLLLCHWTVGSKAPEAGAGLLGLAVQCMLAKHRIVFLDFESTGRVTTILHRRIA